MSAWPSTLPLPNLAGYKLKKRNNVLRTDMDSGQARHRRRSSFKMYDLNVVFRFTKTEKAIFDTFFEDTIFSGVAWFTMDLTLDGTMKTFAVRFIPDSVDESALAALNWEVSAKMEAKNV